MTWTHALLGSLIAIVVSCAASPLVLAILRRWEVLDRPCERSSHVTPVPRCGGVAPALGALVALTVISSLKSDIRWAIALAATPFGLLGLVDDVVGIRPLRRLGVQVLAATGAVLFLLDDLTGSIAWRSALGVFAIFWLVGYVNAYNFMDGIDGISIAQALGAGATWFLVGAHAGRLVLATGGVVVAGAVVGFAPFNLPHARMFLGDVGSYFIGAWLAAVALLGLRAGVSPEAVLAPLALYVADTGTTLLRRIVRAEQWYLPHRSHVYQRLADAGWSHAQTSALVAACISISGMLGAVSLGNSVPRRVVADVAIAGVIGAYLLLPKWIGRTDPTMAVS